MNVPSRYRLALALGGIAALAGCTCGERPALLVSVRYQGFEPGCIQVIASDDTGAAEAPTETLQVPEGSRSDELVVAVYRDPAWGPTLRVRAEAREVGCGDGDPVVASDLQDVPAPKGQTQPVSLSLSATDADRDRYVAAPAGRDCADADPAQHPGAQELCDGQDQDCDQEVDEGFGLGGACSGSCAGTVVCFADGGAGCPPAGGLYLDQDGDGAGAPGMPACSAPDAGLVANQDDCDDGDPFSAAGFQERCDRRDNDCDGRVDLSSDGGNPCPASPAWVDYAEGGGNHDWHSVWSWASGGAWIASARDSHFAQKLPQSATFSDETCGSGVWRGIWADPRNGVAYAVGDGMKMLVNRGPAGFVPRDSITGTPGEPRAVVGFPRPDGGVELYVVGENGDTARWDGGAGVEALDPASPRLLDIHGTSPGTLFAVGSDPSSGQPRISRFVPPRGWANQALPSPVASSSDTVVDVHAVSERLAYAVTDGGRVLRWDGQGWELHPQPDGGSLVAVLAFGTSSVFALGPGRLWEWDGGTWGPILSGVAADPLRDLHGTNPADIWVVGDNGTVFHWPQ